MPKFNIQQDYTEIGTNYFTVTAKTLEEAIRKVQLNKVEPDQTKVWEFETGYNDSTKVGG